MNIPRFLKNYTACSMVLLLAVGCIQIAFSEKIKANGGLGYDGVIYAHIVREIPEIIVSKEISTYHEARIFPCIAVHYLMSMMRIPKNPAGIALGFALYNLILLLASTMLWGRIAGIARLSPTNTWLGFVFLFCNFALLKMTFYYASLTDTTAFTLGLALLYAYLSRAPLLVLVCAGIGLFSWPTMIYNAAILYVFPRNIEVRQSTRQRERWPRMASFALSALFIGVIVRYHLDMGIVTAGTGSQAILAAALPLSVGLLVTYVFWSFGLLFRQVGGNNLSRLMDRAVLFRALTVFGLFVAGQLFIRHFSSGHAEKGILEVFVTMVLSAIIYPAIFWVSHVVYFGPVMLFVLIFYRDIARSIRSYGLGMAAAFALNAVMLVLSESRCVINALPFIVFFVVLQFERMPLRKSRFAMIVIGSLLLSKIWLPIANHRDLYFMNFGPWMPLKWYAVQTAAVLLLAGAIGWSMRGKETPAGPVGPS